MQIFNKNIKICQQAFRNQLNFYISTINFSCHWSSMLQCMTYGVQVLITAASPLWAYHMKHYNAGQIWSRANSLCVWPHHIDLKFPSTFISMPSLENHRYICTSGWLTHLSNSDWMQYRSTQFASKFHFFCRCHK